MSNEGIERFRADMKTCPDCLERKPLTDFYKGHGHCKPCSHTYSKRRRIEQGPKVRAYAGQLRERNRDRIILQLRAWRKRSPSATISKNKWIANNREKRRVHAQVQYAIRTGKLMRPVACEDCKLSNKPDAHHEDYSKPFEITWLCRKCHAARDKRTVKL